MPSVRSVSMGLYIKVGSRYEEECEAGASHFIEHLLFKGCRGWPTAMDIATAIEGRGGYLNASTGHEYTTYWVKIGSRHWRESMRLLANMVQHPTFRSDEVELERGVILDEIYMYRDVPEDLVSQLSNKAMWGDNPLGREIAGEIETVSSLTPQFLRDYHTRAYQPDRAVLTIAGAIDVTETQDFIAAQFDDWQISGDAVTLIPAPELVSEPRHRIVIRPSEQAHLQLAVPGLSRHHPDRYALSLLSAIIGDGMTSRLWQRLREELGLAYSIGSYLNMFADSGVVGVYGGCDAKRILETLVETMNIWSDLQQTGVPEHELRRFKEYIKGRMELSSEDSSSVAAWWARQVMTKTDLLTLDQVLDRIEAVTTADIQRLAQVLWQPQRLTLAYVGPLDSEEHLMNWLMESAQG